MQLIARSGQAEAVARAGVRAGHASGPAQASERADRDRGSVGQDGDVLSHESACSEVCGVTVAVQDRGLSTIEQDGVPDVGFASGTLILRHLEV